MQNAHFLANLRSHFGQRLWNLIKIPITTHPVFTGCIERCRTFPGTTSYGTSCRSFGRVFLLSAMHLFRPASSVRRFDREPSFHCLRDGLEPLWSTRAGVARNSFAPAVRRPSVGSSRADARRLFGAAPRFPSARGRPVAPEGLFRARAHAELGALPSAEGRVHLDGCPRPSLGPPKKPAGIDPRSDFFRLPRGRHSRGRERGLRRHPVRFRGSSDSRDPILDLSTRSGCLESMDLSAVCWISHWHVTRNDPILFSGGSAVRVRLLGGRHLAPMAWTLMNASSRDDHSTS